MIPKFEHIIFKLQEQANSQTPQNDGKWMMEQETWQQYIDYWLQVSGTKFVAI